MTGRRRGLVMDQTDPVAAGLKRSGSHRPAGLRLGRRERRKQNMDVEARSGRREKAFRLFRPGPRGWAGRGGGSAATIDIPVEYRGTSVQTCGLWPFVSGTGAPMMGVPLGPALLGGGTVCCDMISAFRANLISNPSAFILGLPGLGKTFFCRHMLLGMAGCGHIPMALGDIRPDYSDLILSLGGQVIRLGPDADSINVLDLGLARLHAHRVPDMEKVILAEAASRRLVLVMATLEVIRGAKLEADEETILDRALMVLDEQFGDEFEDRAPVAEDLRLLLDDAPDVVREASVSGEDPSEWRSATRRLRETVNAFARSSRWKMFARQSTRQVQLARPMSVDVSRVNPDDRQALGLALLVSWSLGFATVDLSNRLSDARVEPQRHYVLVQDELWRGLRAGPAVVDRYDSISRLNRVSGVSQVWISHTTQDLQALAPEERAKAMGFVERAGMVFLAGLPRAELEAGALGSVLRFSERERAMLTSWSSPPGWPRDSSAPATEPPGRGKLMLKIGERPGVPFRVQATRVEIEQLGDTNGRWIDQT